MSISDSPRARAAMLKDVVQAERDQEADCARINDAVGLAEAQLAARARRDEIHKFWPATRETTILAVADVRRNIIWRADKARQRLKEMGETFFRKNGTDAASSYSAYLEDMPTKSLLDHLKYLIRTDELDRVRGVRAAFEKRVDRHPYVFAFEEIAAQSVGSDSGDDVAKRLARICRLSEAVDAKLTDLWFRQFPELGNPPRCSRIRPLPTNLMILRKVGCADTGLLGSADSDIWSLSA
jgi:hypothetical protein